MSLFALLIAVVALLVALSAQRSMAAVDKKLEEILRSRGSKAEEGTTREAPSARVGPASRPEREREPEPQPEREPERQPEPSASPGLEAAPRSRPVAPPPILSPVRSPIPPPHRPAVPERRSTNPSARSLEERLGASLPVWFGAVALALAGVFLVRHFIERGMLGPGPRIVLAVTFGFALLASALRLRPRLPEIARGLAAAGVVVLSGAVYSATAQYGFLSPLMGVCAQGLVTGIAVGASLRFGALVLVVGLLGGLALPALVGPGVVGVESLVGYLTVLHLAVAFVGRKQGWWWVPALGSIGSLAWAFAWPWLQSGGLSVISPFAVLTAAIAVFAARGVRDRPKASLPEVSVSIPWLAVAATLTVLLQDLSRSNLAAEHWAWIGVLCLGSLVGASREVGLAGLPWALAMVVAVSLWMTGTTANSRLGAEVREAHNWAVVGYGLLFGIGGHLAGFGRGAQRASLAWLPAFGVTVAFCLAQHARYEVVWPGIGATVLAGGLAVRMRSQAPGVGRVERESGLWTAALVALGFVFFEAIPHDWRVLGLAALPVAAASLRRSLGLPRLALMSLAASGVLVAVLLIDHLRVLDSDSRLFLNPLSLGTLAVAVSLLATSRVLHRAEPGASEAIAHQIGFVGAAALLSMVWVVQAFRDLAGLRFVGGSTLGVVWIALGLVLFHSAKRWAIPTRERPGSILMLFGLAVLIQVGFLVENPLHSSSPVGSWPIVNGVLLAYGGGAVLALASSRAWKSGGDLVRARLAGILAFVFGFALVSLEVRQAFVGSVLSEGESSRSEVYAYSAVWLVYGAALLTVGVRRGLPSLRVASLLVVSVAVLKVFLFDASELDGLLRVLSFFGLGVALIGLAWVYQRFVVVRDSGRGPEAETMTTSGQASA